MAMVDDSIKFYFLEISICAMVADSIKFYFLEISICGYGGWFYKLLFPRDIYLWLWWLIFTNHW